MGQGKASIEKIKAIHGIKDHIPKEEYERIIKSAGLNEVDINKRLKGLENEKEFILIIYLLGWTKDIVGFEEGPAKLTGTIATDLMVTLHDDRKILVEIKSTDNNRFKISENQMKEKIKFAQSQNADLYFAIKLNGFWMLHSSDYLLKKNKKIDFSDYLNSEFNKIFGDRSFLFKEGLKIKSTYSKSKTEHLGISNINGYGNLIKYKIEYKGRKIAQVTPNYKVDKLLIFLLEGIHDQMAHQSQEIIELNDDKTIIIEELKNSLTQVKLSTLFLSIILHMYDIDGENYTANKFYSELVSEKEKFLTRDYFLVMIRTLVDEGYIIYENRDNHLYNVKDLIMKEK